MALETAAAAAATLIVSAALTWLARKLALSYGIVDVPNNRSSHVTPTPRGGGLAIVLTSTAAFVVLAYSGLLDIEVLLALLGGGLAVATVGFLDDRNPIRPRARLMVHLAAAIWAVAWVGGVSALRIGEHVITLGVVGQILAAIGIVWILNLFNFMDGIDGIAASEAVFVALGTSSVAWLTDASGAAGVLLLGMACAGFLLWNWPPAKIFMGDVGSGYVGYVLAVLALAATREDPAALWVWIILGGAFLVDATVTLLRRMTRGENLHEAHRSHAYQRLARRWGDHCRVTLAVLLLNVLWLLPCALLAALYPSYGLWITGAALLPVLLLTGLLGAGKNEDHEPA